MMDLEICDVLQKCEPKKYLVLITTNVFRFGLKIGGPQPEKHETERSEKSLVHPALAIEEDDDGKCEKNN